MPRKSSIKRFKQIIIQVGPHIETFELDSQENMINTKEEREKKINRIKRNIRKATHYNQKEDKIMETIPEEEPSQSDFLLNQNPTTNDDDLFDKVFFNCDVLDKFDIDIGNFTIW